MDHVEPQSQPQPNFMEIARSIIALNQQNQLNQFYRNSLLQAGLLGQAQPSATAPSLDLSSVHQSNLLNTADNEQAVIGGSVAGHSAGHSSPGEEDDSTSDVKMEEDEIKNENNDEIESISTTSKSESIKDEAQSISAAASIFKLHGKLAVIFLSISSMITVNRNLE